MSAAETGLLVQLGVGSEVSARSAKRLKRWHAGVAVIFFTFVSVPKRIPILHHSYGNHGKAYEDVPMFNLEPGETSLTAFQRRGLGTRAVEHIRVALSVFIWYRR